MLAPGRQIGIGDEEGWKPPHEGVRARPCAVAGDLDDSKRDCRERGLQPRKGSPESNALKVGKKRYAWDLRDRKLFALGFKAWMNHERTREGYDELGG
jgi:hypothetical protein